MAIEVMDHGGNIMERSRGGGIVLRRVVGVRCVHYIEEKDCTPRFAIWGYMRDS